MTHLLQLTIRAIALEAVDIVSLELVDATGLELPAFSAGAHLDIHLQSGVIRSYSLCNDPRERHRYVIAVLKAPNGRGGSRSIHESIRVGQTLPVTAPKNHFPLSPSASRHILLAGGIGITPMLAMTQALQASQQDFFLYYCTRDPERTAFRSQIAPLVHAGKALVHHDEGRISDALDIASLLRQQPTGNHLYYCGPPGFMKAVKEASSHWSEGSVHFEFFEAPAAPVDRSSDSDFEVVIASSGARYSVGVNENIVEVLRREGVALETSCDAGVCGTCKTRYLDGAPIHSDFVLTDAEHTEWMTPCCSRARGALVLDL